MTNKVDFDSYTNNYNELLRESTKFFSASEQYFAKYKIDLIRTAIKRPIGRILEYGCGIGRNIRYLQSAFPEAEIIGTDISKASLEIAESENAGVRFEVENSSLNIGTFDLIFVAGVFHHIPVVDRASVVQLLAQRLASCGSICIFEHNPFNPITRRIVDSCPYDADAVLLKPAELRALLSQAQLTSIRQEYCLFIPPKLSYFAPIERYLYWLPLGGQYWLNAGHSK